MKLIRLLIVLLFFSIIGCSSTQTKQADSIEPIMIASSKKGKIVAINNKDFHYFIRINTKNIQWKKVDENSYLYRLDNNKIIKIMNVKFVPRKNYKGIITDKQILAYYSKVEHEYFKKKYGNKVKYSGRFFDFKKSNAALWSIELPKNTKNMPHILLCLSIVKNKKDIITAIVTPEDINDKKSKQLIAGILYSVATHPVVITQNYLNEVVKTINNMK